MEAGLLGARPGILLIILGCPGTFSGSLRSSGNIRESREVSRDSPKTRDRSQIRGSARSGSSLKTLSGSSHPLSDLGNQELGFLCFPEQA